MGVPLHHIRQDAKSARLIVVCKRSLKVKSAWGTSQDGVKMAYSWRIFDMRIEEKGTRVGLLVDLYSVVQLRSTVCDRVGHWYSYDVGTCSHCIYN